MGDYFGKRGNADRRGNGGACLKGWKRLRDSITAKFLFTFLFLLILPMLLLSQIFAVRMRGVLRRKEQADISDKISLMQTEFDRVFSEMDNIAVSLILDYNVTDVLLDPSIAPTYDWFLGYKTLSGLLSLLSSNSEYNYGITISGYDDNLYQVNANYNNLLKSASPTIARVQEGNGSPVIFNRSQEAPNAGPVVTLGRSIYRKAEYVGTVLVDIRTDKLDDLVAPYDDGTMQLYVLKDQSEIVYSSAAADGPRVPTQIQTALANRESAVTLTGTRYMLTQIPARQESLSIVTLVVEDMIFQESSRIILTFVLSFSLLIFLTAVGISTLTVALTKNIRVLNDAVTRFGKSPADDIQIPIQSRDEIGQLAQGIESMFAQIKGLFQQIRQTEQNKRIMEFNALQAQINPHMIYNTLNTITYLAQIQNVKNIQELSTSFANLLRSISNQGEFVTVGQEIESLKAFISIKKYNVICDIQTEFQIEEAVSSCRILKLLLQPFVENSITHGFAGQLDEKVISVTAELIDGFVSIHISDNGIGMDEAKIQQIQEEKNPSQTFLRIGIRNVIERLRLQYGEKASLSIFSAPGCGTTVEICFPGEPLAAEGWEKVPGQGRETDRQGGSGEGQGGVWGDSRKAEGEQRT